jgi:diguanylate cyclase (GGDEF)-like protein
MLELWLKVPAAGRAGVAALACLGLFVSDTITSVEMNESQLYPIALMLLYRVRSRRLIAALTAFAVFLAVAGYLIDPPADIMDGVTNRVFSIVTIVAVAFGMVKLTEHEHRLLIESITDPLTGLLNRRHFMALSNREETRSRRHGLVFSVLMIDIDHFKKVNDTYGHPIGDLVIKALADVCNKALRPHDILARFGGEEFVLTLPQTERDGAVVVAERIRQMVEQNEVATDQGPVRFTVSIGVSTYLRGKAFDQVMGHADQALYRAKEGGRNRVVDLSPNGDLAPA